MKNLKTLAAALMLACGLGAGGPAQAETLRVGLEAAYPPFSAPSAKGGYVGFDIDIANALCRQMQVECEFIAQDWDGIIPALMARKFDAIISSMAVTKERAEQVDFTGRYYRTSMSVAVPRDAEAGSLDAAAFKGKVVGAQSSSTPGMYAEDVYGKAGAEVRLYPTADEAGSDLASGRLDALVHDKYPLIEWMRKRSHDCCRLLGDLPGTMDDIAIAVRKGDDALRTRLDEAILAIRADGSYQRISQRYFGLDIY
ncbi:transporter substrate-binding domain-containing protein [Castellaniella defragrans]|jgi:polar amino acid transport system substrate-binding protein|uniref:Polar amino acid transport system substrate-binding protein n=1 Tax=Castellaniella defragrans TaxID=75697 RepID=A0A7W9WM52_CASDE|nr:transporter substrate-binding domain-containing protein [Castellaniella defragrans]KAB0623577.1 transporter substrate-binding domain-containing protein [Castellaniella defragrans]MBB6083932.1 polar amino acid transport system substrate-binding protein [Castellaniella defragrans]